jgi:hypothetical protein
MTSSNDSPDGVAAPQPRTTLQKLALAGAFLGLLLALALSLRFFIHDFDRYELSRSWGNVLYVVPPLVPFIVAFFVIRRRNEPLLLMACLLFEAVATLLCGVYADFDPHWRDKPGSLAPLVFLMVPALQLLLFGLTVGLTALGYRVTRRRA